MSNKKRKTKKMELKRLSVNDIKGDSKQEFLKANIGKTLTGINLLKGLRASKLVDNKSGFTIKVYGALTNQIKTSSPIPTQAKLEWEGMKNNPSRSKANLIMGISAKLFDELKQVKAQDIKG